LQARLQKLGWGKDPGGIQAGLEAGIDATQMVLCMTVRTKLSVNFSLV
jgi:hypothetical protein